MNTTLDRIASLYTSALSDFLTDRGESALVRANALGREALAEGLGILDMTTIHDSARIQLLAVDPSMADDVAANAAEQAFLAEALSPFEIVHRSTVESHALLRRVHESLESEVRHMAHALHDDVGPLLFLVHMSLHALAEDLPSEARSRVLEIRERLDEVEDQLRRLSHELRPMILEDLGLSAALRYLADGVASRTGITVTVECADTDELSLTVQTALYRIIQQALINVSKHARATRASVVVIKDARGVRCAIADDGVGFECATPAADAKGRSGLGLVGMKERAEALGGTLTVSSAPGRGTRVHVMIPPEV